MKRLENETNVELRERRRVQKQVLKAVRTGYLAWDSGMNGTYKRAGRKLKVLDREQAKKGAYLRDSK